MHILLTDRLACPRCGPEFGLILIADVMERRRVRSGVLGCPNCRDRFPIDSWIADLRPPPRVDSSGTEDSTGDSPEPESPAGSDPEDRALRLAAFLGVTGGGGHVGLAGAPADLACGVGRRVPEVDLVTMELDRPRWVADSEGGSSEGVTPMALPGVDRVSPLRVGGRFPLFSGSLRGLALSLDRPEWLDEALRVTAPGGRIVAFGFESHDRDRLRAATQDLLAEETDILIVRR